MRAGTVSSKNFSATCLCNLPLQPASATASSTPGTLLPNGESATTCQIMKTYPFLPLACLFIFGVLCDSMIAIVKVAAHSEEQVDIDEESESLGS
jgi:hypothetical protein